MLTKLKNISKTSRKALDERETNSWTSRTTLDKRETNSKASRKELDQVVNRTHRYIEDIQKIIGCESK